MEITGFDFRYENGIIYKGEKEMAYLQIGDDRNSLEDELESIKENERFSYEDIVDMILSNYDLN